MKKTEEEKKDDNGQRDKPSIKRGENIISVKYISQPTLPVIVQSQMTLYCCLAMHVAEHNEMKQEPKKLMVKQRVGYNNRCTGA